MEKIVRNNNLQLFIYIVLFVSVFEGASYLQRLWTLDSSGLAASSGRLAEWDYSNLWAGGKLALSGNVPAIFDVGEFRHFLGANFHVPTSGQEWSYPPNLLLIGAPLAMIPLFPSYLIWTFGTIGLLFGVLRAAAVPLPLCLCALLSPAIFMNAVFGQNGSLSAALLCGGLLLLRRSPVLAGVLFGLLTFKPHLGVMIPICLLASRQWSAIAAATLTTLGIALLTAVCFGAESWSLFFSQTVPMMRGILEAPYPQQYQVSCVSVFMLVRSLDGSLSLAWICQGLAALIAAAFVWRAWAIDCVDDTARVALTIVATFLSTPYAYMYDMVSYCVAISMLAYLAVNNRLISNRTLLYLLLPFALLWFWPELQTTVIKFAYYQVSAAVVFLGFVLAAAYCLFLDEPRRKPWIAGGPVASPA